MTLDDFEDWERVEASMLTTNDQIRRHCPTCSRSAFWCRVGAAAWLVRGDRTTSFPDGWVQK